MAKLRDTIKLITKNHLLNYGIVCCQNLTGIGSLQNTFPSELNDCKGVIELPTSDVSNSGIAVGLALSGKRVMYVVRFAGFLWLNASNLVNYAAKSKDMWDVPCNVFTRVMSTEGSIGPTASGSFHSMIMHMPGIKVIAPMTSKEWEQGWNAEDPVLCSESRFSYDVDYEMEDVILDNPEVTIFAISTARLNILNIPNCSLSHIFWLKPLGINEKAIESLKRSKFGIVVDSDYEMCGASQYIACELMKRTGKPVYPLGREDKTAGFFKDNLTPSTERIIKFIDSCNET